MQSDDLLLSTVLVSPTSRSAPSRIFRPTITIGGEPTQVLTDQTAAVAPERLGELAGHVNTLRDPTLITTEARRLERWIDSLS